MNYVEKPPSPRLEPYVRCFWSLEYGGNENSEPEPVIPDGCIEIIFNLADRFRRYHTDGRVELQPSVLVAGQMERRIMISPSGNVRLFGIRFQAAGAYPFFDFPLCDVGNRIEPADGIWGSAVALIEERLLEATGFDAQVEVAEAALTARLSGRPVADERVFEAISLISQSNGRLRIRNAARQVGISERGLERLFTRYVGITPKSYSRVVRFQGLLRFIEKDQTASILDTALSFGYYDQSHLINDFRMYTGMTPGVFAEKSLGITNVFIAGD